MTDAAGKQTVPARDPTAATEQAAAPGRLSWRVVASMLTETRSRQPQSRKPAAPPAAPGFERPRVSGKFLWLGRQKLWVRGVTYGTFRPDGNGIGYRRDVVERDFAQIAAHGLNAIRTYSVPPRWLLDVAQRRGLRVMIGLPWEQHVTFLDNSTRAKSIEARVRAGVHQCAAHPAVLCYAVGNEIPAPIVRWHGHRRVERYIEQLYLVAKAEDPDALVTYVNYPTTEYLQLPFLDLVSFNVYVESQGRLEAYLARLHNLAGDRPLMMAEIGLDSRRHGEQTQASVLDWQVRTSFATGCAGVFLFAWTDEWHRGGYDIEDWDFGLTTRDRRPKPALAAVRHALGELPFPKCRPWPRISVIVCTYNGARTIRDCFEGLLRLEYPNFEVIVVNDGSTDGTAALARAYGFRVISHANRGLSSARNTGLAAATGQIVAYIDDDAWPDPHWLTYLADTFMSTPHVGVGGPNIPPGSEPVADCVANAPGGPVHVLLTDREAEHIPGCNMAFRKAALEAIGGFDPQFRTAGDDVDVCWQLRERGWTLGFNPGAGVWHHRRNSVREYWRQQVGYGKAEALLERKWPQKYNAAGHLAWGGRLYGKGLPEILGWRKGQVYQGTWGNAPFQSLYERVPGVVASLPLMPEWYLVIAILAALAALGTLWRPLLGAVPLLALAVAASLAQAALGAARASFTSAPRSAWARVRLRSLTAVLHMLQPLARLCGRLLHGLTPWRARALPGLAWPRARRRAIWIEDGRAPMEWLQGLEGAARGHGAVVRRGGDYDRWDLELRVGTLGAARVLMATEEHGAGRRLVRFRAWPRCPLGWLALAGLFAALATGAGLQRAWAASVALGGMALLLGIQMLVDCAAAMEAVRRALDAPELR
jgi:GT2 family glycosyltransferase